jgi:hypothetical protein
MPDYGTPASYLTLAPGTAVYSSDGAKVGEVAHVLAVPEDDIFDGVVIDVGGGHRFVDAPQVREIFEDGVELRISEADAERLPEPSENAPAMEVGADDMAPDHLRDKLRRAWDLISGNY